MEKRIVQLLAYGILVVSTILFYSCKDELINSNDPADYVLDADPSWSPDGYTIVYAGGHSNPIPGLYTIDILGNNKEMIFNEFAVTPEFSPDGNWILFESFSGNIFKKRVGKDSLVQLTFEGGYFFPTWSKDGQFIAFDTNRDSPNGMYFMWKMKSDGSDKKRIIYLPDVGEVRQPSWFPDGIRLAVTRWIPEYRSPEIAIIDTNGNSISILTNDDFYDRSPKVSNNSNIILYSRDKNN